MEFCPSEASSPFPHNQADQTNFQPVTSGGLMNYQTSIPQLYQSEPSKSTGQMKRRGRRPLLGVIRKRGNDRNRRLEEQGKLEELTNQNSYLKTEYYRLTEEIRQLKEDIGWLQPNRKLPVQDLKRVDSYFSQSTSQQHDNKSISVQDHRGKEWGAVDRFSGFQMNHGVQDQQKIVSFNEGLPINVTKSIENSLAGTCYESTSITELLMKIDADEKSNVNFSDFPGLLDGERVTVGSYSFPLSLCPTAQRINDVYGDIAATSKMNASVAGTIYVLFCATIKEMDHLQLQQVTENKILKWRDAIKDALRIGFHVGFAMEHLKKIARAYVGFVLRQQLKCMALKISKLEADLNARKEEHAKLFEQSKLYADSVDEFGCKSVSTGLFP